LAACEICTSPFIHRARFLKAIYAPSTETHPFAGQSRFRLMVDVF
jgi:hypothetical protein